MFEFRKFLKIFPKNRTLEDQANMHGCCQPVDCEERDSRLEIKRIITSTLRPAETSEKREKLKTPAKLRIDTNKAVFSYNEDYV